LLFAGIFYISLVAFGARASLVVALLCGVYLVLLGLFKFVFNMKGWSAKSIAITHFSIILIPSVVIFVVKYTDIACRIVNKFEFGASAYTRVTVYEVLRVMSCDEWLFGASSTLLMNLSNIIENGIVENFWIAWLLQFGLVGALPIAFSLLFLWFCLFIRGDLWLKVSVLAFAVGSYSNNSLSAKTPVLLFFLVISISYISTLIPNDEM
jgi:hypothetical protein